MTTIRAEIERIYHRDGAVTASAIVQEARDPKSRLHGEFDWNDATAAHEHRLAQARRLIRRVRILGPTGQTEPLIHVAVVSLREGIYLPSSVVVSDVDLFARAKREAIARLDAARSALDELIKLREAADLQQAQENLREARAVLLAAK